MAQGRIDPIATSESIRETYLRYLTTTFGLKNSDLARQFRELARKTTGLFRGPILEATPKYRKGKSLLELATDPHPIVSDQFLSYAPGLDEKALQTALPIERNLYAHQEKALQKVCSENRNIVVATGTGSGKTECFLLPIIDHLLRERESKKLGPGVRAVLVYPMNALANDQVIRLRKLLPPETGITFGRYTGQTKQTYQQGLDSFKQENNILPQANELFCRDQILGKKPESNKPGSAPGREPYVGPPHILLTNFAMLEYLLMRPQDSVLFDGPSGNTWRFLVLDEAHIYTGAQGTEISYLMRRLKDRVCRSQPGKLLCIATSATVGATNEESLESIATSFQNLFGEPFDKNDIITGDVVRLEEFVAGYSEWGSGSTEFYQGLSKALDGTHSTTANLLTALKGLLSQEKDASTSWETGWPDPTTIKRALSEIEKAQDLATAKDVAAFLLLVGDSRARSLINLIESHPTDLPRVVANIWASSEGELDEEAVQRNLIMLVDLASRARLSPDSPALLSARYHFFVRSLEGLSILFEPDVEGDASRVMPRLLVGRHHDVPGTCGGSAVAFELQACGRCGQPYLRGTLTLDGRLVSYAQRKRLDEPTRGNDIFSIDLAKVVESAEDEDPLRDEQAPTTGMPGEDEGGEVSAKVRKGGTILGDPQYLCTRCGFVADIDTQTCPYCKKYLETISNVWVEVRQVVPSKGNTVRVCPACGAQKYYGGSIIRSFSPGDDAAGAVIGQCLISNIPESSEGATQQVNPPQRSKTGGRFSKPAIVEKPQKIKGKRRLLAFSDSRQDAAYFATYMNRTSNQILHRQLIYRAAERFVRQNPGIASFDVKDLINPLIQCAQEAGLFSAKDTEGTKKLEVCKWLNGEIANIQKRQGLEGVGLIRWSLKCAQDLVRIAKDVEDGLIQDYQLNAEELVTLLQIFLTELRQQNVLQPINGVRIQDSYFWPRNRPYTICPDHVNSSLSIASWHPQSSRNARSDFLERLFSKGDIPADKSTIDNLLRDLWEISISDRGLGIWEEVHSVKELWGRSGQDESAWRLRWDGWLGRVGANDENGVYKCDTCGNITTLNLRSVCPAYCCPGTLQPINPDEEFGENHYRYLYTKPEPISILALEHTAQITHQEGAERQIDFTDDHNPLNMLSCSTTFELGVDVGQLHSVFLRNVPPGVANYVQRAGRAGRRWSAAAYVLTFCRSRPHDLGHFMSAEKLIAGKVQPPRIQIDNHRIARRHLHAVVLSRFWRFEHPEYFDGPAGKFKGIVEWFFFNESQSGTDAVYRWLQNTPLELSEEIYRIFPDFIASALGFDSWKWVPELAALPKTESPNVWEGCLGLAQSEMHSEHKAYEDLKKNVPRLIGHADKQIKRLKEKQLLGFLASRNVLPKYGFPVDVVSLKIESKDEWAQEVELDRDLKIALSEYAPGCTLVANGKIIKSYALERIAGKAWPEYQFAVCKLCGRFYRSDTLQDPTPAVCDCGQSLNDKEDCELRGKFVEPSFGFRTLLNEDGQEPVEVRPQRTFSTRVFFSRYRVTDDGPFIPEGCPDPMTGVKIQKRYSRYGMLTVINPGISKRGFWLCPMCGYGDAVAVGKPEKHKTPWGAECKGTPKQVSLGHEFQSDVLELRFSGGLADNSDQGFWLSLTSALLAGAAKVLDIERDDIDGTVLTYGGTGYRAIVLFDSVPGGAGHVKRIHDELQPVLKAAFEITESCTGCSRDQSCNGCLRNFRNQYAHDLLRRGPTADFLLKVLAALYENEADGFIPLGFTDASLYLSQEMKRAGRLDLVLDEIPTLAQGRNATYASDICKVLYSVAIGGATVHLFLEKGLITHAQNDSRLKASLHSLTLLCGLGNVTITLLDETDKIDAPLYLEIDDAVFAYRWPAKSNPFAGGKDVELTTYGPFTSSLRGQLDTLNDSPVHEKWDLDKLEKILQGTKIVRIQEGEKRDWKDILSNHLPTGIREVQIYDRFLRNRYQFKSLQMFLDALSACMTSEGMLVEVTTTSEEQDVVKAQFKTLQEDYGSKGIKIKYQIHEPAKELPHYRRVLLKTDTEKRSIWLDKGLDIFRFDTLKPISFKTQESYVVIEDIK